MSAEIKEFPPKKGMETQEKPTNESISHVVEEENEEVETKRKKEIELPHAQRLQITDTGNADLFCNTYGDICIYIPKKGLGNWVIWDGKCWVPDDLLKIEKMAEKVMRDKYERTRFVKGLPGKIKQHAITSLSAKSKTSMLKCAKPHLTKSFEDFDQTSGIINVENGILDLESHELLPHDKSKLMTKIIPYPFSHDNAGKCPDFLNFMHTFMSGNEEMINFLQKFSGYMMSGDPVEHCMPVFYGNGRNGKSTFLNVLKHLMGSYGVSLSSQSIMRQQGSQSIRNDIARLKGARFVDTSETPEGKNLDEPLLKQLTGQDTVTARFLNQENFDFKFNGVLFLNTNYKPDISGTDEGIWSRMRMIPCTAFIPEEKRDKHLMKKLVAEMPGILYWAATGYLMYKEEGLISPDIVKQATNDHREAQDRYGEFVQEHCNLGSYEKIKDMFSAYSGYCKKHGEDCDSRSVFIEKLRKKYEVKKHGQGGYLSVLGINLKPEFK